MRLTSTLCLMRLSTWRIEFEIFSLPWHIIKDDQRKSSRGTYTWNIAERLLKGLSWHTFTVTHTSGFFVAFISIVNTAVCLGYWFLFSTTHVGWQKKLIVSILSVFWISDVFSFMPVARSRLPWSNCRIVHCCTSHSTTDNPPDCSQSPHLPTWCCTGEVCCRPKWSSFWQF